ncbi:unnamed protein product (macronuclear) [Paramecium tetraurelia]|uniref:Tyrosine-protein phosphatase domain-containing protein n=1 Tax=Paramecium tetraurelia TaxID=5888 RepID=A0BW80_PARTE|nr:uncharacterized protein GSPATT00032649001 [Paramecium tetraurelia]CAK62797.1 unnamed protein product [Paramecium tetraurelia]|eukprot:XP_001430195.1 hypothetical protein (macronuclear) [Paramecium tetraurelia strain d4-2]
MQRVIVYYAFKIWDGLFIGNSRAPLERDFLLMNKINNIINCAAAELTFNGNGNVLCFNWRDADEQSIVTTENLEKISEFIETATNNGEGVLFFSLKGQSRALTALSAYLIYKYRWGLIKTLQFLNSRRKDFEIRPAFLKQLLDFSIEYFKTNQESKNWDHYTENQEILVIQNTYLNSQQQPPLITKTLGSYTIPSGQKQNVSWSINLIQQIQTIQIKEEIQQNKELKSILKGSISNSQKDKQVRCVSVIDNSNIYFDESILQNMFIKKKLQTPKINSLSLESKASKNELKLFGISQQRPVSRRPQYFTPEKQRILHNTKQILDTYLNAQLNNISLLRGRAIHTPMRERIRAISQQNTTPNKTPTRNKQSFFLFENQNTRWINPKKQPQFKIK